MLTCSPSATSLALDDFPDDGLFFRTAPSDSLQAEAIAQLAERTGASSAAVVYLDDIYGRPLAAATITAVEGRGLEVTTERQVPFTADDESLLDEATALVMSEASVMIVIGDADQGLRMLTAISDVAGPATDREPPQIIVNDAMRAMPAAQVAQVLGPGVRERIQGVAPVAQGTAEEEPLGPFATNAYDCVNLVVLAAMQASTDARR